MTYVLVVWLAGVGGAILVPSEQVCQDVGQMLARDNPGLQFACIPLIGETNGTS